VTVAGGTSRLPSALCQSVCVAVVEMDLKEGYQVGLELSTELIANGVEVPFTAEPRDEVSLPEEVAQI